jgi:hypothetical protein
VAGLSGYLSWTSISVQAGRRLSAWGGRPVSTCRTHLQEWAGLKTKRACKNVDFKGMCFSLPIRLFSHADASVIALVILDRL